MEQKVIGKRWLVQHHFFPITYPHTQVLVDIERKKYPKGEGAKAQMLIT